MCIRDSLCPGQRTRLPAQVARVLDDLTGGQDCEVGKPEIDSDIVGALGEWCVCHLDHKRRVVPPVRLPDHRHTRRHRRQDARPHHANVPDLRHPHPAGGDTEAVAGQPDRGPVVLTRPEPGMPNLAAFALAGLAGPWLRGWPLELGLPSGLRGYSLCDKTRGRPLIGNSEEAPKDRTGQCWNVDAWTTNSAPARAAQPGTGAP